MEGSQAHVREKEAVPRCKTLALAVLYGLAITFTHSIF